MGRAVFLDRDGVINQKAPAEGYITRWEDFRILSGVTDGIALLNRAGFSTIVITNQRCIAKGLLTVGELDELHRRMSEALAESGARIDAICYCPHELEDGCNCRKPAPGMLLDASRAYGIDLARSWMIGDSDIDVQAGRNAGCKTARIVAEGEVAARSHRNGCEENQADIVAPSLVDAVHQILKRDSIAVGVQGEQPRVTR
jgi:D-glycero-D-manno-heptose 1,7-bisphosphate phosphatase